MSQEAKDFLIRNVLLLVDDKGPNGYGKFDVYLSNGIISKIDEASGDTGPLPGVMVVDGSNKMLLPGFVNAHTHSIEQWGRGLIKQLPLELWVEMLMNRVDPRLVPGTPAHKVYLSSLHIGVETLMTGGTAIIDHLFVRDLDDVEAAVNAYKQLGIRAYIAPMLGDLERTNYYPLVGNAKEINDKAKARNESANGLAADGHLRESIPPRDPEMTQKVFDLWKASVEKFHDPENGINIAIGPVQNWSASDELIAQSVDLRKQYNLCGHIHLLESRAQKLWSRQKYPDGGAVKRLKDLGWLSLPGTSCAHCCWLEEEEQKIIAECGAVVVHNPVSNIRLGSGIAPIKEYAKNGVIVAIGCDGSCSNDGQDMLEAVKLACILNPLTTPEYRDWVTPREVLRMAAEGGAAAINMTGKAGRVEAGYAADVALYDLTALSLLPRTDPVGLLVMGRPSAGAGGNALHSVWVRGQQVISDGVPTTVDLDALRAELQQEQPNYTDPETTDPTGTPGETEYRAALGLSGEECIPQHDRATYAGYPHFRVNYPADIAK